VRLTRRALAPDTGVLLLYVVDKDSRPLPSSKTRRNMEAKNDLIGLGVIFPHAELEDDGEFIAADVRPLMSEDETDSAAEFSDTEGDFEPEAP
jgi:hypothetical protein